MSNLYVDECDFDIDQHYFHFQIAECKVSIVHLTLTKITVTFESLLYKRKGDRQKEVRSGPKGNEIRGHDGGTCDGREERRRGPKERAGKQEGGW
jgi:hypothetical protein